MRLRRYGLGRTGGARLTDSFVRVEVANRVATIWIDRPPLNILDLPTLGQLDRALAHHERDGSLAVLVVRGAGNRAFSAGVAVEDHTPDRIATMIERFHGALRRLEALNAVTVAAVHGHCLGGGMELAAACDLVIARDDSRFGQPEIKLGCFPPYAAARYPRMIGSGPAADLLLTGRTIDTAEAERIGFIARRAAAESFDDAVASLVGELTSHSTPVLHQTKKALRAGRTQPPATALREAERVYLDELATLEDMREGVDAFVEKRPPTWRHR